MNRQNNSLNTPPCRLGNTDCKHCAIRDAMLFCSVNSESFDHIFEPIDNLKYPAKSQIYTQGEQGHDIFSIRHGLIKLVQHQPDGNQRIVRLLGAKDTFGIEALLSKPYHHTAIVLQELSVCRIPLVSFIQLEAENPSLNNRVMLSLDSHLNLCDQWLTTMASGSTKVRLINFLLAFKKINKNNAGALQLISYKDIASIIGTSRETVTRIMTEFKLSGVIQKGVAAKEINFNSDTLKDLRKKKGSA